MTRRSRWLGIASMAIALMFVPQAAAGPQPNAKFKIVSASGREALSFQEDGTTSTGTRCVGSAASGTYTDHLAITLKRLPLGR